MHSRPRADSDRNPLKTIRPRDPAGGVVLECRLRLRCGCACGCGCTGALRLTVRHHAGLSRHCGIPGWLAAARSCRCLPCPAWRNDPSAAFLYSSAVTMPSPLASHCLTMRSAVFMLRSISGGELAISFASILPSWFVSNSSKRFFSVRDVLVARDEAIVVRVDLVERVTACAARARRLRRAGGTMRAPAASAGFRQRRRDCDERRRGSVSERDQKQTAADIVASPSNSSQDRARKHSGSRAAPADRLYTCARHPRVNAHASPDVSRQQRSPECDRYDEESFMKFAVIDLLYGACHRAAPRYSRSPAFAHAVVGVSVGLRRRRCRVSSIVVGAAGSRVDARLLALERRAPCLGRGLLDLRAAGLSLCAGALGQDRTRRGGSMPATGIR